MSGTADPKSARAHARAQGAKRVEAMPTLPARDARDLPAGVNADALLWEETIAGGGYASKRLQCGARVRLIDLYGDACASILVFNPHETQERLNVADTIKVQWNGYLGAGKLLLSDMGRVMFSILEDEAGAHDCFCGASNETTNSAKYGDGSGSGPNPSARDRFIKAVAKHGLSRRDVHPCINFFKGVRIDESGATHLDVGPYAPGRSLTLRAEMDVILIIANCPHVLDPRPVYTSTPLRVTAWRGPITPEDDPIRNAAPEALRAFLNAEAYIQQ
ncbi:MAG: urea carboxylase-associated family protein [Hyphomonadaceae bacterium]|nr:urea carboxylase-associated family protein [Hyphomonadaceae bacterium]